MAGPSTDEIERTLAASELPWVRHARTTLNVVGVFYVLIGLAALPAIYFAFTADPAVTAEMGGLATALGIGLGVFTLAISVGVGALNFVAASGLRRGRKWAWYLTVVLGGIYTPSACLPFGVILLYGMLRDEVRSMFLG